MVRILKVIFAALIVIVCGDSLGQSVPPDAGKNWLMPIITVVYDNNPYRKGVETAWGFSCLVEGIDKTILFDTGGNGRLLMANMGKLGIAPLEIDAVVVSHIHRDHVGGLHSLLKENRRITTYLPGSFPDSFERDVEKQSAKAVPVHGPTKICDGVYTTGQLGTSPREQSLVARTARGLVIVTGCAHPGIERVVRRARERFGGEVLLVLGGFHLTGKSKGEIETAITALKKLGVRHVALCHCTGDAARMLFMRAYGAGFIDAGVGKVIDTEGLR